MAEIFTESYLLRVLIRRGLRFNVGRANSPEFFISLLVFPTIGSWIFLLILANYEFGANFLISAVIASVPSFLLGVLIFAIYRIWAALSKRMTVRFNLNRTRWILLFTYVLVNPLIDIGLFVLSISLVRPLLPDLDGELRQIASTLQLSAELLLLLILGSLAPFLLTLLVGLNPVSAITTIRQARRDMDALEKNQIRADEEYHTLLVHLNQEGLLPEEVTHLEEELKRARHWREELEFSLRGQKEQNALLRMGLILSLFNPLLSIALHIGEIVIGLALLNTDYETLGIILIALVLNNIASGFLSPVSIVLLNSVTIFFGLARVRLNIIIITLLAAIIPFLNGDSWQIVAAMPYSSMMFLIFLVYVLPVGALLIGQRKVIMSQLFPPNWELRSPDQLESIQNTCHVLNIPIDTVASGLFNRLHEMQDWISTGEQGLLPLWEEVFNLTRRDKITIYAKTAFRSFLFLILIPLSVAAFVYLVFQAAINNQLLAVWLDRVPQTGRTFDELKFGAAILLGVLTAASSVGTLLANNEELTGFIAENFGHDVHLDRRLLTLWSIMSEHELDIERTYEQLRYEIEDREKRKIEEQIMEEYRKQQDRGEEN